MKASTMPKQLFEAVNKAMSRGERRRTQGAVAKPAIPAAALTVNPLAQSAPAGVPAARPAVVAMEPIPAPAAAPATNIVMDIPAAPVAPAPVAPLPQPAGVVADRFTITYGEPITEPLKPAGSGTTFFIGGTRLVAEPDTEFHAQIRELFLNGSAARLETIRELAGAFVQAQDETVRAQQLDTLFRKVHALAGNAGLASCTAIAHFASMFEVLLKELRDQPSWVNHSTVNTVARTVESLEAMFANPAQLDSAEVPQLTALVVETDAASSRSAAAALESARFLATTTEDPVYAIGLLATMNYDLVVAAIHLQGMTGFELLSRMEALPQHQTTPVLFVTTHDSFDSYLADQLVAQRELIARPYPPIEMTLKALSPSQRKRLQP